MADRYLGMDFSDLSFVEEQKLKGFFHKFTEEYYREYKIGHVILAAYAAVPTYINPDLLYKIWMNFKGYHWRDTSEKIHLVAVVDLINSSFCEEIGPKLYMINTGIRKVLNKWLEKEFDLKTKKIVSEKYIAHFINAELKHYQKDYNLWGGKDYVFDQSLNADLLVYPERALEKIKKNLYHAESDTEKLLAFNLLVNARKKISTEIEFDEIAELGKGWKEYLLGKPTKLLKKLESLESSFLKDEPSFRHSMEITIPMEIVKEEVAQKRKKRVYGVFVGVDEYEDAEIPNLDNCAKDAKSLHDLLKNNIDEKKNKVDFKLLTNENATYDNVKKQFEYLENLDDGDTFIFHYSGHGHGAGIVEEQGRFLPLSDTRYTNVKSGTYLKAGGYVDNSISQNELEEYIYEVIKEKNVHCIFILDGNDALDDEKRQLYRNKLRNRENLKGSLIILDGVYLISHRNFGKFGDILLEVLRTGGLYMSYNEIHEKLRLNILQQNSPKKEYTPNKEYIPRIEAFPPNALHLKFLNNTENLYDNLEIYWNNSRNQWEVNAGFNKGINSSIPLMPTILELEFDGGKIKLQADKSYLDYTSLMNFTGDPFKKIKTKLLQNSLKKILFYLDDKEGFDKSREHELKNYLERINVPLVEITEERLEAKYVISHNSILGYFVYDPLFGETLSIVELQNNIEDFIIHLEYLTHWEGLLQYSNINSKLNQKDFEWALSLNNGLMTQQFFNLSNIEINVKENHASQSFSKQSKIEASEDLEIKCAVTYKDQSSGKELKEEFYLNKINGRNPEISFELLKGFEDSDFGLSMLILEDNLSIEEMPTSYILKGNQAVRGINYDYVNTVRSKLKKSKQLYLKIFLSNKKINYKPFLQEGTNKDIISKSLSFSKEGIFDASEVDWLSYTVPINITLNERKEELENMQFPEDRGIELEENKMDSIRELISEDKLEKAIETLMKLLSEKENDDESNTLILISSRFHSLRNDQLKGTITNESYSIGVNRIRMSMLHLLDELEGTT